MDRFYAPGDAPGDKHYSSVEESLQERIQERIDELHRRYENWDNRLGDIIMQDDPICDLIEAYLNDVSEMIDECQEWYRNDDFEAMESYLWGIDNARKQWHSKQSH